jgi:hypothetical protein
MAHLVDRFSTIALIERFNHVARQRMCDYAGLETNMAFKVLFISTVEGDQHIISIMMGESLGQLVLPTRYSTVFHTSDLYRINEYRVRLSLTVRQTDNGLRHLELAILECQ